MRKRNRTISIRVSEQEYEAIQKKIQATKQTQQSFILNAIEGAAISTAKDSKQLKDISMQLNIRKRQLMFYVKLHQN